MCQKRHRTTFNQFQLTLLEEAFKQNNYPSPTLREILADKTHLDASRVQVWFQNRRAKHKKQVNQAIRCFAATTVAAAAAVSSTTSAASPSSASSNLQHHQQQQQHQHHHQQNQQVHNSSGFIGSLRSSAQWNRSQELQQHQTLQHSNLSNNLHQHVHHHINNGQQHLHPAHGHASPDYQQQAMYIDEQQSRINAAARVAQIINVNHQMMQQQHDQQQQHQLQHSHIHQNQLSNQDRDLSIAVSSSSSSSSSSSTSSASASASSNSSSHQALMCSYSHSLAPSVSVIAAAAAAVSANVNMEPDDMISQTIQLYNINSNRCNQTLDETQSANLRSAPNAPTPTPLNGTNQQRQQQHPLIAANQRIQLQTEQQQEPKLVKQADDELKQLQQLSEQQQQPQQQQSQYYDYHKQLGSTRTTVEYLL